jgi:Zn ribbon nucleic-acid-binding protein
MSFFQDNCLKAKEILDWLSSEDIIQPKSSNCVLGYNLGYAISDGAKNVTDYSNLMPFDLITNGLEITTERQIFDPGQNGLEACYCPNCAANIKTDVLDFLEIWFEEKYDNLRCTNCGVETEINNYNFEPKWGFSNLGFTFWNWPDFEDDFIKEFQKRLGTEVILVRRHI